MQNLNVNFLQVSYLNDYNKKVRDIVGPELKRQGKTEGYSWMMKKTEPIKRKDPNTSSGSTRLQQTFDVTVISVLCYIYFARQNGL